MKKVFILILTIAICGCCCVESSNADVFSFCKRLAKSFISTSDDAVRTGAKSTGRVFGKTTGGSSTILGHRIGCYSIKNYAAHHIIPVQLRKHRALRKIGMDMDEAANGIALPTKPGIDPDLPLHRGSHPSYTAAVKKELDKISPDASVAKTRKMVSKVQSKFRERLEDGAPLHEKYGANDPWY